MYPFKAASDQKKRKVFSGFQEKPVQCERLPSAPQCSGAPEGCMGATWLAGFHAYMVEESTEATLYEFTLLNKSSSHLVSFNSHLQVAYSRQKSDQ
ncbi:unnamed protein product [Anisakis simplex]|uniref:Hydrocephalus-inducing protein homolog n=1 Tax=Anisakis simplex TaxID=6269 RepID=A0A0M3JPD5_ANISI|nr:unnamed protein product [Anisakis simplex]